MLINTNFKKIKILVSIIFLTLIILILNNNYSFLQNNQSILIIKSIPDPLLLSSSCELPCWNGIIVGTSNYIDVKSNINSIPMIKYLLLSKSSYFEETKENYTYFTWKKTQNLNLDKIVLVNGIVKWIDQYTVENFTLQNVLSKFGKPNATEVTFARNSNGFDFTGLFILYYPNKGLVARFKFFTGNYTKYPRLSINLDAPCVSYTIYPAKSTIEDFIVVVNNFSDPTILKSYLKTNIFFEWDGSNADLDFSQGYDRPYKLEIPK